MILRALILGAFSTACIGVAVLGYQSQERRAEVLQMASSAANAQYDCMNDGFDTELGRIGCLQPASFVLEGDPPSRLRFFIDEVAYVLGL